MMLGKRTKAHTVGKPNAILYVLAVMMLSPLLRLLFGLKIAKHLDGLRAPFIVVANHACNIDSLFSGIAMYPYRLNYLAAELYFRNPLLRILMRAMGAIPKKQFTADARAVLGMMRVLSRGDNVILFPAGQSSYSGEATFIDPGIGKLLKKMGVSVVSVVINGGHIGFPKWNMSRFRKAKVEINAHVLFTPEEIASLCVDDITQCVRRALYFNDYDWQKKQMVRACKPRKAEGIEKILFICPKCLAELCMSAKGSRLWCNACGNAASMDEYGFLHADTGSIAFTTPTEWARWQHSRYMAWPDDFVYAERATLWEVHTNGRYELLGEGTATMRLEAFTFEGDTCGQGISLHVCNELAAVFPHEKETSFEFCSAGRVYSVKPDMVGSVFKFVLLKQVVYDRLHAC